MFSQSAYIWEGLDPSKLTVIAPSIDAFSPKNHLMGFTTVTAVLRAAALAGDHDQHPRAVFERLDGSVGLVCNQAQRSRSSSCVSTSPSSRRSRAGTGSRIRSACWPRSPSTSRWPRSPISCWPAPT